MSNYRVPICLNNRVLRHHGAVAGTTGSGKSNLNSNIVGGAINMDYRVFLFDHKPDFQDLEKPNNETKLFNYQEWVPEGFDCNINYFSLSEDGSSKANIKEKLINVHASSFEPYQLAAALFHKRGEELQQENMTLLLTAYKDEQEERNKFTWNLADAVDWIRKLKKEQMPNVLGGGSITDSSKTSMLRKLQVRTMPWMDRKIINPEEQLPGLSIPRNNLAPETNVGALIQPKTINVIRVGQTQGRDYGLFLSFLLDRVYSAKASKSELAPVLYLIDEAQDIFSGSKQLREACEDMLDSNMRKGRSLNIAFWYGLQKFSALPESITINLNSRIVMTHKQTGEALNALPGVSKETLSLVTELKPGEALVSLFGSNSIVKAKMHPSRALLTKD